MYGPERPPYYSVDRWRSREWLKVQINGPFLFIYFFLLPLCTRVHSAYDPQAGGISYKPECIEIIRNSSSLNGGNNQKILSFTPFGPHQCPVSLIHEDVSGPDQILVIGSASWARKICVCCVWGGGGWGQWHCLTVTNEILHRPNRGLQEKFEFGDHPEGAFDKARGLLIMGWIEKKKMAALRSWNGRCCSWRWKLYIKRVKEYDLRLNTQYYDKIYWPVVYSGPK